MPVKDVAKYGTKRHIIVLFNCVPCARVSAATEVKNRDTRLDDAGDERGRFIWRGYVAQPKPPLATTGRAATVPRTPSNALFQRARMELPGPAPPAAPLRRS